MAKKSKRKKTKTSQTNKTPKTIPNKQTHKISKFHTISKKAVAAILFVITVLGFLFLVYPRISVYPGESLDPHNPLKTPFIIKNDGYLPVRDIKYSLFLKDVHLKPGIYFKDLILKKASSQIPILRPNRSSIISIKHHLATPKSVKSAEIYIDLSYKPYLIPYMFTEHIRFKTEMDTSGKYLWLEYYSER